MYQNLFSLTWKIQVLIYMWVLTVFPFFCVCQGEDEADGEDDEEEDDGFFVPHGYLSDDEGVEEDGSSVEIDEKVLESTACLY